jgi:primosomal protein N' (replication factor Y) (superfamily II helicase)
MLSTGAVENRFDSAMSEFPILRVALDTPLRRLFDYLAPAAPGANPVAVGARVEVPFGRQRLVGVIVDRVATSDLPVAKLKPVYEVLDAQPIFDPPLLKLLGFAASYYHHPLGEVIAAALPKLAREGARIADLVQRWYATADGVAALQLPATRRARKQYMMLERLAQSPDGLSVPDLTTTFPNWRATVRTLAARGWVSSAEIQPALLTSQPAAAAQSREPAHEPSVDQATAIAAINSAAGRFAPYLLYGSTGSGKTEVYLRAVAHALEHGKNALVLVPEIGLTPQLVGRFAARFAAPIAVLHSGLTDRERLEAWRSIVVGEARIVIGTRSAVFAPIAALGLIIVDEEHDASFKQQDSAFRYSARDVAIVRAQQLAIPIVLGSATPSLETLQNTNDGRYAQLTLARRAGQSPPPRAATVDLRQHAVRQGLSTPAVDAIRRHLQNDGQVLVFINRRGYAPTLACTACGWCAPCGDCDAKLTVHLGAQQLRCHHCGAQASLPTSCPQCGYAVRPVGQGTERVEETLAELFPAAPIARLDRDVARKRGDIEQVVSRVSSGEARILVGTQMVTKGHDFPNLTLVVVLNADQGLFSTDFRAPERLAQTIIQVAGRAGRAHRPGEVLIQTEYPEHPLLQSLLTGGYDGFATSALSERAHAKWPPFSRIAALRASAPELAPVIAFLRAARQTASPPRGVKLLGPAPAAMAKRAARYHAQLLVEAEQRNALHSFLEAWLERVEALDAPRSLRWSLDVDPLELI